jgi:DNA-binding PadR family transcriptional regulator
MPTDASTDPTILVLTSLADGPKHGHAILVDIASYADRRLGPGTLYGAIARLEAEGLVEPMAADGRRRPYRLTPAGRAELRTRVGRLSAAIRVARTRLAAP